jgi:dihydroorotase
MRTVIRNVLLNEEKVNISIEEGKIKEITKDELLLADTLIDADGLTAIPSFIDMQVHFREPGFEYKETIESGSLAAAAGGFTQVAIMPNTNPTIDNLETLLNVKNKIKESSLVDVHIIPAMTKGLKGKEICNFKEYKENGIFAITDDGIGVQSDEMMEKIFKEAAKYNLAILQHCEVDSISNGGSIHEGTYSKKKQIKGIPSSSESEMIKRDIDLLRKHGGHYHVLHVSAKESVDLIRLAKKEGLKITCEVTPHHLFLNDEDIKNSNFKMNPPLRSIEDMQSLQDAFIDGTIDIITTDHAPHSIKEKKKMSEEAPFGVIGLETSFPLLYSYFVAESRCTLKYVVDAMSTRASEIFNLPANDIRIGENANLTLINTGQVSHVNQAKIYSKSSNTPFMNHLLKGWPQFTIKKGEVIYER